MDIALKAFLFEKEGFNKNLLNIYLVTFFVIYFFKNRKSKW
jgi:hypothetical protein